MVFTGRAHDGHQPSRISWHGSWPTVGASAYGCQSVKAEYSTRSRESVAHKAIDAIGDGFRAWVRTNIWYRVSASGFCEACQTDTRGVGIFIGPESYVAPRYEGGEACDWQQLNKFALVRSAKGLDVRMTGFIEEWTSIFLRGAHGALKHHCEHCDAVVPDEAFELPLMERFSGPASKDELQEVGSFLKIEDAILVSLLDDTIASRRKRTREGYFALARLQAFDEDGEVFTVDLHHNIVANDYAILIKGDDGKEIMALGFSDGAMRQSMMPCHAWASWGTRCRM